MKITRTILAANEDPIYYQFWNPISRIYLENFGIKPTLIWFGKSSDIYRLELSQEFGSIIVQEPHPKHHIGWQSAWSIFWFMNLYPDDTFCTMGIDQVPLSPTLIKNIPDLFLDDTYLMLADDGYLPSHWSIDKGTSPTSFHLVKGSIANKVYGFEKSFFDELDKISESGIESFYKGENKWGLEESYSSHKLRQYRDSGGTVISRKMFEWICERRIECCREKEIPYNVKLLKEGWYGDAHLCRPFSSHKLYIENLLSAIGKI